MVYKCRLALVCALTTTTLICVVLFQGFDIVGFAATGVACCCYVFSLSFSSSFVERKEKHMWLSNCGNCHRNWL